jgi:hypothetical protein
MAIELRIIGNRAGQTSVLDVVTIFSPLIKFDMSNPIFTLPIPSTGNATTPVTKLINLRRVTRKIIIDGLIVDTTYANLPLNIITCGDSKTSDGSARNVAFSSTTGTLTYTGGTCLAIKRVLEKKWVLEQFALAGANSGKGLTLQWREVTAPNSGTDYLKNETTENLFISELSITDEAKYATKIDSTSEYPEMMRAQLTLVIGTPAV